MKPLRVIGLNSGTSMDGIDAALFEIEPLQTRQRSVDNGLPRLSITMSNALVYPFEPHFQSRLRCLVASGQASLEAVCRLNAALGELFADAARTLVRESGLSLSAIDLIGSHGQTIWHCPAEVSFWGTASRGTLQLADPAIIAERLRVPTVGDFRAQDMAAGGQGAPLVAFADQVLFGWDFTPTGVLNLGGIANITAIDQSGQALLAFDTGPGNMVIDRAAQTLFKCQFDEGGALAARGKLDEQWLSGLLEHPYFQVVPPKSTGRELFGQHLADRWIQDGKQRGLSDYDILATLTAVTPLAVVEAYLRFIEPATRFERLVLGGGGADNKTVSGLLSDFWPQPVKILRHEDFGISTRFKEALLFALLAYTTYFGIANNVPRCTGARRPVILGKLCRP